MFLKVWLSTLYQNKMQSIMVSKSQTPRQVGGGAPRMPAGASPEPLAALPSVPMWEHDGFGRGAGGSLATPFGFPASAFYAASLQVGVHG